MKSNWKKSLEDERIEGCSSIIKWYLPQIYQPNEFMVAHFILEKMQMERSCRIKIYLGQLADWCNMSSRTIKRITASMNDKGVIKKELIGDSESKKTYNFYYIDWQKTQEFLARFVTESGGLAARFVNESGGLAARNVPLRDTKDNKDNKDTRDTKDTKELEVVTSNYEDDKEEDFGLPF